jgi:hypothetical protein
VVAKQQIRGLYALHPDLCEMVPVLDEIRCAQSPDERPEVHPHGLPGHIETLDVVQHTAVLRREFSIIIRQEKREANAPRFLYLNLLI